VTGAEVALLILAAGVLLQSVVLFGVARDCRAVREMMTLVSDRQRAMLNRGIES
jgi:hypothetical protein